MAIAVRLGGGRDRFYLNSPVPISNIMSGTVNGGDHNADTTHIDHYFATVNLPGFERINRN